MALEERKKLILKAVVDKYIETAEPVGSKSLTEREDINISSATIRNEMAELEEGGYLVHPHTSSGRVPTDKGYREYVDNLITIPEVTADDYKRVSSFFESGFEEVADLLQNASSALSENTGYTSVSLTPGLQHSQLKQIKMLMIEPGKILMVVVLKEGVVKDRIVRISDILSEAQLSQISNAIEEGLSGVPLEEITFIAVAAAGKKTTVPENLLNQILYEAYVSIKQADNVGVYMDGGSKILSYPEFGDIRKAKDFMDTLSERGMVAGYMDEVGREIENPSLSSEKKKPYMIRIGQEISLSGFQNCSFVTTTYRLGEKIFGSIGVIGPKRMDYAKVISKIDFVRTVVNDKIKKIN